MKNKIKLLKTILIIMYMAFQSSCSFTYSKCKLTKCVDSYPKELVQVFDRFIESNDRYEINHIKNTKLKDAHQVGLSILLHIQSNVMKGDSSLFDIFKISHPADLSKFITYTFIKYLNGEAIMIDQILQEKPYLPEKIGSKNLFVFVGEKIEIINHTIMSDQIIEKVLMDHKFIAKYKVIEEVFGNLDIDTISFTVYDHYGVPSFSETQTVLLYVKLIDGEYYHSKYQYSPLFKTENNEWAGPYNRIDYEHPYNLTTKIKPIEIDFKDEASFDLKGFSGELRKRYYPSPFYRIEGDKAIAVYGNYIPELFELKKTGVLKARNIF